MQLDDAITELRYAKEWSPQTVAWYSGRLDIQVVLSSSQRMIPQEYASVMSRTRDLFRLFP